MLLIRQWTAEAIAWGRNMLAETVHQDLVTCW